MTHNHRHHRHHHAGRGGGPGTSTRPLATVLALTAGYAVVELIGGWLTNSLALLADAGHMLTDVLALALALLAAWSARRPPDESRTYGYQRVEILTALLNGVALTVIAVFILIEAWERLMQPPAVEPLGMAGIAAGGLLVNLVGAVLLRRHRHGMNVRAAYLHVLGDLLGSIGTLAAAALVGLYGWLWADPAVSAVIGAIIVWGAVRLVLDSVHVLLEGTPAHLDATEVRAVLAGLAGVSGVHDLHLWSLGGESPLLTAHLVLDHSRAAPEVLRAATAALRERFGIDHATLQLEPLDFNVTVNGVKS
jgi:cobalt-zinc-cadmium efflux system protein